MVARGDVVLIDLDLTRGGEIRKTRPCAVVSPDELNLHLRTLVVVPLTTGSHPYPFRVSCKFAGKSGCLVADQVRTIDRERVRRRLGKLTPRTLGHVLATLREMFAE